MELEQCSCGLVPEIETRCYHCGGSEYDNLTIITCKCGREVREYAEGKALAKWHEKNYWLDDMVQLVIDRQGDRHPEQALVALGNISDTLNGHVFLTQLLINKVEDLQCKT